MNKKEWKKIDLQISKYHSRLYHILNNKTWVNPFQKLTDLEKSEEKKHQSWKPDHISSPLSVGQSAKLFAVQHVFEGLTSDYKVNDMLHFRHECYIGQAIANEYRKEIEEEFSQEEIQWFIENVDYADLQQGWE